MAIFIVQVVFILLEQKKTWMSWKKKCKKKDFRGTALATQKIYILKFNQCMKSDKTPCIIYADLKSLIKKIDNCKNNPEKSSATKMGEHIPCGYLILTT